MNTTTEMSDEKLIQFYLNGNPKAMAAPLSYTKDRIYSSIYSMVHDKTCCEEIFQRSFIVIINNLIAGKTADEGQFCNGH